MNGKKSHYPSINRSAVPNTRKGKHRELVSNIIEDLQRLAGKQALRIPRSAFGSAKLEHIRAALSRASLQANVNVATSTDDEFFYVWRQE